MGRRAPSWHTLLSRQHGAGGAVFKVSRAHQRRCCKPERRSRRGGNDPIGVTRSAAHQSCFQGSAYSLRPDRFEADPTSPAVDEPARLRAGQDGPKPGVSMADAAPLPARSVARERRLPAESTTRETVRGASSHHGQSPLRYQLPRIRPRSETRTCSPGRCVQQVARPPHARGSPAATVSTALIEMLAWSPEEERPLRPGGCPSRAYRKSSVFVTESHKGPPRQEGWRCCFERAKSPAPQRRWPIGVMLR